MKEFEVWAEGYIATGESSSATLHGKVIAESNPDGYRRNSKGNMCVWACGCYDNEAEARVYFG